MLISLLKLLSDRYLLLGGCLAMSIRTLKQTFKQKNKNYIYMLLCKYGEVYSWLQFCPCSCCSYLPYHHSPTWHPFHYFSNVPCCPPSLSPITIVIPPMNHPMSSCLWGWWQVVCHLLLSSGHGVMVGLLNTKKRKSPSCCKQDGGGQGVVSLRASGPTTLYKQGLMAAVGVDQGAPAIIINSKITI